MELLLPFRAVDLDRDETGLTGLTGFLPFEFNEFVEHETGIGILDPEPVDLWVKEEADMLEKEKMI